VQRVRSRRDAAARLAAPPAIAAAPSAEMEAETQEMLQLAHEQQHGGVAHAAAPLHAHAAPAPLVEPHYSHALPPHPLQSLADDDDDLW
jgi:hypothetical protein